MVARSIGFHSHPLKVVSQLLLAPVPSPLSFSFSDNLAAALESFRGSVTFWFLKGRLLAQRASWMNPGLSNPTEVPLDRTRDRSPFSRMDPFLSAHQPTMRKILTCQNRFPSNPVGQNDNPFCGSPHNTQTKRRPNPNKTQPRNMRRESPRAARPRWRRPTRRQGLAREGGDGSGWFGIIEH